MFPKNISFIKEMPGIYSGLGAILISFAIFSSGFKKIIDHLSQNHWLRSNSFLQWLYDFRTIQPEEEDHTK